MHPIRAILHLTQFIYTDIVCGVTNIRCGINKLVVENMLATDLLTKLSWVGKQLFTQQDIYSLLPISLTCKFYVGLDSGHWLQPLSTMVCWHTSQLLPCFGSDFLHYRVALVVYNLAGLRIQLWWIRIQIQWAVFVHRIVLLCSRLQLHGRGHLLVQKIYSSLHRDFVVVSCCWCRLIFQRSFFSLFILQ